MRLQNRRDSVFILALCLSLLFHLSMVTVFRIVIYFPRHDINYFNMQIVDTRRPTQWLDGIREELHVPTAEAAIDRLEQNDGAFDLERWATLPPIELPTLEFDELDRLRIRREGLRIQSRFARLLDSEGQDAWARFGSRLGTLGDALARFTHTAEPDSPRPVSRPAPGFAAYVEWMSEPTDREALSVSKIEALWGLDSAELNEPIALVFKVDREGKVVQIIETLAGNRKIVDGAARALMRYRFEPLGEDMPPFQHGTLLIQAESKSG